MHNQAVNSENDSALVRQQLFNIENQHANILELLQKLINRSEESLAKLEARVAGVESVVGSLVTDVVNGNGVRSGKLHTASEHSSSKIWKRGETFSFMQDRPNSFESLLSTRGGRNFPAIGSQLPSGIAGLNENRLSLATGVLSTSSFFETQANPWRVHVDVSSDSLQRRLRNEAGGYSFVNKNVQDRAASLQLGEGPSARNIWQASKDEATLAAIRVAGDDGRVKLPDCLEVAAMSNQATAEVKQEVSVHKIGGQGKGPFWSLWARAAEVLHSGDVDLAYVEVLCVGDELLFPFSHKQQKRPLHTTRIQLPCRRFWFVL